MMAQQKILRRFAKWHIWLGWLIGVPILMWTVTGLIMVWQPIEYVRGNHLRAETPAIQAAQIALPTEDVGEVSGFTLQHQLDGPIWIVTREDGGRTRYSAQDGLRIGSVGKDEARLIAQATYTGAGTLDTLTQFADDEAPMDLRIRRPSWQASYSDGTHVYLDQITGEVLAVRSGWWRIFDFVWGLHIMDLQDRENTSHPILIIFAALSAIGSLLGCALMFRRRKARVKA